MTLRKPFFYAFGIALGLFVATGALAWTGPSVGAPNGNASAPLNVSSTGQTKVGGLRLNSGGAATGLEVMSGTTILGSDLIFTQGASTRDVGIMGTYDPTKLAAIWSMGAAYKLGAAGTAGNLYGLSYSYEPNYGATGNNPGAIAGLGHQMQWRSNGVTQTAIGTGIHTVGTITANARILASVPAGYAGWAVQGSGGVYGVYGQGSSYGVYGESPVWAGYFAGNTYTTGTATVGNVCTTGGKCLSAVPAGLSFGGMYTLYSNGVGLVPNVFTGGYSCPSYAPSARYGAIAASGNGSYASQVYYCTN